MKSVVVKTTRQDNSYWGRTIYYMATVFLVMLGTKIRILSIIPFAAIASAVWLMDNQFSLQLMVFFMPFAGIMKLSPTSTSLYTYLMILFAAKKVFDCKAFPSNIMLFLLYLIAIQMIYRSVDILRTVKLISNMLFVSLSFEPSNLNKKKIVMLTYLLGVIISSFFAMVPLPFYDVAKYVGAGAAFGEVTRFYGMNSDPNFYSVNLILALCILTYLYKERFLLSGVLGGMAAFLIICAIQTYSKSVFIMLLFPFVMFIKANQKTQKYFTQIIAIAAVIIVGFLFLDNSIPALSVIHDRLFNTDGDLSKLTTGRSDIWVKYFQFYVSHPIVTAFGRGLNAPLISGMGAHCIYIDMPNYIGIIGEVWFIKIFIEIANVGKLSKKFTDYMPLISECIMYAFLPGLFDYQLPIILLISLLFITK